MKTATPKKIKKATRSQNDAWEAAKGLWKNRKPDPILEWKKIRKEWENRMQRLEKAWANKKKG